MPEFACYFVGILIALWATVLIAFPELLTPQLAEKKLRFKARHWGSYLGDAQTGSGDDEEEAVEVGVPARKVKHVVGSRTYSGGRGVSMRGG